MVINMVIRSEKTAATSWKRRPPNSIQVVERKFVAMAGLSIAATNLRGILYNAAIAFGELQSLACHVNVENKAGDGKNVLVSNRGV